MKFKKQIGIVTGPEMSSMSKTKTMFIDAESSARRPLSGKDAATHGDVVGICAYMLAKGHSKRIYGILADVTTVVTT